jgi:hypothetical protein
MLFFCWQSLQWKLQATPGATGRSACGSGGCAVCNGLMGMESASKEERVRGSGTWEGVIAWPYHTPSWMRAVLSRDGRRHRLRINSTGRDGAEVLAS